MDLKARLDPIPKPTIVHIIAVMYPNAIKSGFAFLSVSTGFIEFSIFNLR